MNDGAGKSAARSELRWSPMVAVSFVLHLSIFSILVFVPETYPTRSLDGAVYQVNLVEMPRDDRAGATLKSAQKERKAEPVIEKNQQARRIQIRKPEPKAEKKTPLVIAKKTVEKKPVKPKKPEVSHSQLIDRAISEIEAKVKKEDSGRDRIDRAVSRLEKKVEDSGGGTGGGGEGGVAAGLSVQFYQLEVEERIKGNWAYPVALQNEQDLEAVVVFLVKRDGAISDIRISRRSGNLIFDQSVLRAVERSDPLPPFPEGYRKSRDEIEIRFNLQELETR